MVHVNEQGNILAVYYYLSVSQTPIAFPLVPLYQISRWQSALSEGMR